MKYIGSKAKIAKEIVGILQGYISDYNIKQYVEPFAGGFNVIDKIQCEYRLGNDIEKYIPTAQMIAEGDCDGICAECDGRSTCWHEGEEAIYLTPLEKEKVQACILYQEKRFGLGEVEMSEEEREWAIDFYHELAKKFSKNGT